MAYMKSPSTREKKKIETQLHLSKIIQSAPQLEKGIYFPLLMVQWPTLGSAFLQLLATNCITSKNLEELKWMPLIFLLSGNISSNRKQLPSFFSFCTGQEFSCPNDEKKKKIQKENDSPFQLNQSRGLCNFYSKGCTIWFWLPNPKKSCTFC